MVAKIDRTGEIKTNTFGSIMIITNYKSCRSIDVYFPEYKWTKYNSAYKEFSNGNIKCPYEPRTFNIGYMGEGEYDFYKNTKIYTTWSEMLRRCYNKKYQSKEPTYIGCEVCKEWYNFQTFAKWFEENYYEVKNEGMALDKDILIKGNKIYSPKNCVFVPKRINNLFTKNNSSRGSLPIGVRELPSGKFQAYCNNKYNKWNSIGTYPTINEAFNAYKEYKELLIKEIADEYKIYIPSILYDAMYKYEVEIND